MLKGHTKNTISIPTDPPQFTLRPLERYIRVPNEDVTFPCSAQGTPNPSIKWRKVRNP